MFISDLCSRRITNTLCDYGKIQHEYKETYQYCLDLTLDFLLFHGSLLVLGCITGRFPATCLYIVTLTPLKMMAGGAHAKTPLQCSIISYSIYFAAAFLSPLLRVPAVLSITGIITIGLCILRLAPVNHPYKMFVQEKRQRIKQILLIYLLFSSLITAILFMCHAKDMLNMVLCTYLAILINQIIGLILYQEVNRK